MKNEVPYTKSPTKTTFCLITCTRPIFTIFIPYRPAKDKLRLRDKISPFIIDFIKQVISSVITDINLMNTFTKGIIFEFIREFLQLVNIPANVILPHYSNLLKVDNILNILFILRILPLYYKDIT